MLDKIEENLDNLEKGFICPRCFKDTNTFRHPHARCWCPHCGYVLREEGDTSLYDYKKHLINIVQTSIPPYDSTAETLKHIKRVNELLLFAAKELMDRAVRHDASKLLPPEKECFDKITPRLKHTTFGSEAYKKTLEEFKEPIEHHQKSNSHHPEYYSNGIYGFDLFDLIEMFFDWKAATERHADGDILKSIEINKERFGYSDQLAEIMENTARRYFTGDHHK
jgi:hypothetical protein